MHVATQPTRKRSIKRKLMYALFGIVLLVLLVATLSALVNTISPKHSRVVETLSPQEKSLIAESLQLKRTVGDQVWPGFGQTAIPLVIYNEKHSFWVGEDTAPSGWEVVPGDSFFGQSYFSGRTAKNQAFAVKIGERWAGSMATKEWFQISFASRLREQLPGPLRPVFPYPLVLRLLGVRSSDKYISAVLHETFHAYQATVSPARFELAQKANAAERAYPWDDPDIRRAWRSELQLLARALNAGSNSEAADLAREFVEARRQRRQNPAMNPASIDYERQVEWLEGLGKYAELKVWREGAISRQYGAYRPFPELLSDHEFSNYGTFSRAWSGEISTLRNQDASRSDTRFYYSGMAQAFLLDRLVPDWKSRVRLEDLGMDEVLAQALEPWGRSLSAGRKQ